MNTQTLFTILIAIALLVWISYRQFTWRAVREGRVWLLPAVLVLIGLVDLFGGASAIGGSGGGTAPSPSPLELGLLALEVVISVGTGSAMGALARFRVADVQADSAPGAAAGRTTKGLESRTGWLGLALWLVFIGVRVGFGFWGHSIGAGALESTGPILVVLGFNRGARALVLDLRANRLRRDLVTA